MLFWEIIYVYMENHTKPIDTIYTQTADLLTMKRDGTYN
jgi:hypothetical protein